MKFLKCTEMHHKREKIQDNVHRVIIMSIANMKRMHQNFLTKEKDFMPSTDLEKIIYHRSITVISTFFECFNFMQEKRILNVTHDFKIYFKDYFKQFFHVSTLFLSKLIRRSTRKIRISRKSTLQFTINNIFQPWAIPFHRHIPLKA